MEGVNRMKIALSSSGKTLKDFLDSRFGRCKYFLIYDTEKDKVTVLENAAKNAGGGAGIVAAQQIIDESTDVLITGHLGPNAYDMIKDSGIKAYKGENISSNILIKKYKNGELSEIKEAGQSHKKMGKGHRGG